MKIRDIFYKIADLFKSDKKKEKDYAVKNTNISIFDVPYSIFLVIKKYGWVVFFYKLIAFFKLLFKRIINLYEASKSSFKREGLKVMLIRSLNFVLYGKGTSIFGNTLFIYYGAADTVIACASVNLPALVTELLTYTGKDEKWNH